MFPQLSDLINYFFGTHINIPVQSYGTMVALAFISGIYVIKAELKRKEKEGLLDVIIQKELKGAKAGAFELILMALIGFIIGYKFIGIIIDYKEFADNSQDYIFSLKGNIIGGIVLAAVMVIQKYYQKNKKKLDKPVWENIEIHPYQLSANILIISAISGLLGAKIFHHFENFRDFLADPAGQFFSFMGLTFYGGLIVGSLTVIWYIRKNKMPVPVFLDATAPAIILAYGIGRIGCMLSGDGCWGIENLDPKPEWLGFLPDWMWSFRFPHNVINEGIAIDHCAGKYCTILENPVFPTAFYDTILCTFFFFILWTVRKKIRLHGALFAIMLFMIGLQRFFMEKIRVNNKFSLFGMQVTQAEIISVFLIILSIITFWFFYKNYQKNQKKTFDN
ncbi:MAG TPA: prolipoprotein diacylglyceryl transferase [Bacteroidales bacterium]|nr:prolipoprotein diacylglyceryl transferase [Bacteroidales bacterium]